MPRLPGLPAMSLITFIPQIPLCGLCCDNRYTWDKVSVIELKFFVVYFLIMSAIPQKGFSLFPGVLSGISWGDMITYPEMRREDTANSDCIAMGVMVRVNFF